MTRSLPAEAFPVSEYIVEEMEVRGWTRDQLAQMLVWSKLALDALLIQQDPLTEAQAIDLERVFGASGRFWLNLEFAYRHWKQAKNRERFAAERRRADAPTRRPSMGGER